LITSLQGNTMSIEFGPHIDALVESYHELGGINHIDGLNLPNRTEVIEIMWELLALTFPGYYGNERLTTQNVRHITGYRLTEVHDRLATQIERSLRYACTRAPVCEAENCGSNARRCATWMIERLPEVRRTLHTDVEAAFKGDPACYSHEEAIVCYPGVFAVAVHRIAHVLQEYRVPLLPRIMSEYAHQHTGVDIHPGALISEHFFIDHATGVVIGETSVIGRNVKLYQGVTLGAKSFPDDAREIRGHKRHPTIEDDVVIYANATILGDITIGKGSVIGGNTWLTHDVAPGTTITIEPPKLRVREKKTSA
jgi:serine O-acetyltransferase